MLFLYLRLSRHIQDADWITYVVDQLLFIDALFIIYWWFITAIFECFWYLGKV